MEVTNPPSPIEPEDIAVPWAWLKAANDIITKPPYKEPSSLPIQLKPWLFLSDMMSLLNAKKLKDLGITHVLTTNKEEPPAFSPLFNQLRSKLEQLDIIHCAVDGEDVNGYDMLGKHWETCKEFIVQAKREYGDNAKIVVHCAAGMNRSGLIAAAAMLTLCDQEEEDEGEKKAQPLQNKDQMLSHCKQPLQDEKPTLLNVVRDLKRKRGMVLLNRSFQKQLCILAAKHGCLGDKPEGYSDSPDSMF